MSHRMVLLALALALAFGTSPVAGAAVKTTISGSVVPTTTPSFKSKPGRLVVRLFRGINEIGRYDQPLPATGPSYPFSFEVDNSQLNLPGPFTTKAYILDQGRYIYYIAEGPTPTTPPKSPLNLSVPPAPNPGTQILPTGSAGMLLLLVGLLSIIGAGSLAVWRRKRSRVLTQRFA